MDDNAPQYAAAVEADGEMENMYLNFIVADGVYSIKIRHVLQIVGMQEIIEMPDMPLYMKGIIRLRDKVIPVISMRLRFGKTEDPELSDRACIVVIRVGDFESGLIVDAILETVIIEPESISPPPADICRGDSSFISGIAVLPDNSTSILVDLLSLFGGQI